MESVDSQPTPESSDDIPPVVEVAIEALSGVTNASGSDLEQNHQELERRFRHAQIVLGQQRKSRRFARGPLRPEEADRWRHEIEIRRAARNNQKEPE